MDIELLARQFYDYSNYMRGYAPTTINRYRKIIEYFKRSARIEKIEEINEKNLREMFLNGRTERHWQPLTFISFHRSLSVFFQWCVTNGYMARNFITDIELPKVEKRLPPKLTKQDSLKLLEVVYNYPYEWKYLRYQIRF